MMEKIPTQTGTRDQLLSDLKTVIQDAEAWLRNGGQLTGDELKAFREPRTTARIDEACMRVARWIGRHRRPAIVNEFGVLSFKAPPQSRAAWIRAVRAAAERFCIGWAHWEYADAFGFVRRENGTETLDPVAAPALIESLR